MLHMLALTLPAEPNGNGCRVGQWDEEFAQSVHFKESPIVATPDVTEMILGDEDEFVVIASDGLWCVSIRSAFCSSGGASWLQVPTMAVLRQAQVASMLPS